MKKHEQPNYPFDAVIINNETGHGFKKSQIVSIIDFFMRYRKIDYYIAVSKDGIRYLVSNKEFTVNTPKP